MSMNGKAIQTAVSVVAALGASALTAADIDAPWGHWNATGCEALPAAADLWLYDDAGNGILMGRGNQTTNNAPGHVPAYVITGGGNSYGRFWWKKIAASNVTFSTMLRLDAGNLNIYAKGATGNYDTSDHAYVFSNFAGMSLYMNKESDIAGDNTPVQLVFKDGTAEYPVSGTANRLLRNRWYRLTVTREALAGGTGNVRIYLDDQQIFAQDGISIPEDIMAESCLFSVKHWEPNSFLGHVSDLRVYTNALSSAEVSSLVEKTRIKAELIGHWPMDAVVLKSGKRYSPDISGLGNDLELGAKTYPTNGVNVSGTGALYFDAPNRIDEDPDGSAAWDSFAAFDMSAAAARNGGEVTFSMWLKGDRRGDTYGNGQLLGFNGGYSVRIPVPTVTAGRQKSIYEYIYSTGGVNIPNARLRNEEWSHLVFALQFAAGENASGTPIPTGIVKVWCNGEKIYTSSSPVCTDAVKTWQSGAKLQGTFTIGSNLNHTRPFCGTLDDVKIHIGHMTDEQMASLYSVPLRASAGADFSVCCETAELQGAIGAFAGNAPVCGMADSQLWTLVSAPAGGEGATIENPHGSCTAVTLPVEGEYVFRFAAFADGTPYADDVTVTRTAAAAGDAPVVGATAVETLGLGATVSAMVSDGARVRWSRVSGPGAVYFADPIAARTLVTFTAAGSYVLRMTATRGNTAASADVTVVVDGKAVGESVASGMKAWWPLGYGDGDGTHAYDSIGKIRLYKGDTYEGSDESMRGVGHYIPGVGGDYAWLSNMTAYRYLDHSLVSYDNPTTVGDYTNIVPEEWVTVSMWIYHSSEVANDYWQSVLMSSPFSHALVYHPDGGASSDFELIQVPEYSAYASNQDACRCRFQGPSYSLTNRWTHVLAQFPAHGQAPSEMWVDGVRLQVKSGYESKQTPLPMNARDGIVGFGGQRYDNWPNTSGEDSGHAKGGKFPGALDDIRVYLRHLTETEVRYLAAYPNGDVNLAPDVSLAGGVRALKLLAREAEDVAFSVTDDGKPSGGALASEWRIRSMSGDGVLEVVQSGEALARFFANKQGEYSVQVVATDGERTTWSKPVIVTVSPRGSILVFR